MKSPAPKLLEAVKKALLELRRPENADGPPSEFLQKLSRRPGITRKSLGTALAWLSAYDALARVHEDANLLIFVAAKEPSMPHALSTAILSGAGPWLLAAMRDPEVSDDRKYSLGPLLALAGGALEDDDYAACFKDFEATRSRKSRETLTLIPDTPEAIDMRLDTSGIYGTEDQAPGETEFLYVLELARELAQVSPSAGASLLATTVACAHERGLAGQACQAALELVARTRTPRSVWLLGELGRWPVMGTLGDHARELHRDLVTSGVSGKSFVDPRFSHGLVTGPDGQGSRSVSLFFRTGEGCLHGLSLLLNDQTGLKDSWCVWNGGADMEEQLREQDLLWAPCDVAFARELIADAFACHEATGRAVPGRFLVYRPFLGEDAIVPGARKIDLGAYLLETLIRSPEIVQGSEALMEHMFYAGLGCTSDDAYAFVAEHLPKRGNGKIPPRVVADFMTTVAAKEQDLLVKRVAANLEVEARAGRAQRPVNRLASRVWLALSEGVVPYEAIPYVRALAADSVQSIATNLRRGFNSQAEADEAEGDGPF